MRAIVASAGFVVWVAMSSTASAARNVDQPAASRPGQPVAALPSEGVDPVASPSPLARPSPRGPSTAAVKDLDLSPAVLKEAVSAADEDYARSPSRTPFGTNPASVQAKIDRSFDAAQIEGCGSNALKFDALPVWGDFVIGGPFLVLPYMLHAMATGRCKMWPK